MSDFPLISIIIPIYNNEKYIKDCLDSIILEDYPNKEILIINDGSTDNNDLVIREWIKNNENKINITYKYRENRGVTKTLNELVDLAQGEYIAYLCSDDLLSNNGLRKRYEYLENNHHKKAVVADAIIIDQYGNFLHGSAYNGFFKVDKEKYKNDRSLKHEIINACRVPGPALLVKKDIYSLIGKYDENICYEDWDFYLRMVSKDLLGFIDDIVCKYRVHPANTCRSKAVINITRDNRRIVLKNIKNLKDYKFYLLKSLIYNEFYLIYLKIKFYLLEHQNNKFSNCLLMNLLKIKDNAKNLLTNFLKIKNYASLN